MAERLDEITDGFWNVRGSFRVGPGLDLGTQTSLARLATGRFVLLDSYTLTGDVLERVHALTDGGAAIEAIVNLHPFHTMHVAGVHTQFPHARMFGTRRHMGREPDLPWADVRSEDPALEDHFGGEFRFLVPAGLALVPDDERVHASSVLALHGPTRTLHVDDTLNFVPLPLIGGLAFHPTLRRALERRAGAAADFRAWAEQLAVLCEGVDHVCTAHLRTPASVRGAPQISAAVRRALTKVESTLAKHERRWG